MKDNEWKLKSKLMYIFQFLCKKLLPVWNEYCHLNFQHNFSHILDFSHISYSILETNNHFTFLLTLTNDNIDTKEIPISLEHLMIVYFTVYRLISSVTAVKSIGSAKPGKARVINFKARAKPKARALKNTGLFSITTPTYIHFLNNFTIF